jgi:signal transduction histidine kinase
MPKNKFELPKNIKDFYTNFAMKISRQNDNPESFLIRMRAMLILWTCTTVVMWLYVFYCLVAWGPDYPVPWGGLAFTLIHCTVPLVFYYTQSFAISGVVLSLSGLCFQTLFCLYTGGVYSPAAIWLTFHPVILGFFGSTPLIILQVILNFFIVVGLYFIGKMGLLPPDILPHTFRDLMIISCYVGLDILVACFTVMAIRLNNEKNRELNNARELTDNLLRILCHDINNPLSIIKSSSKYIDPESIKNNPQHAERIKRAATEIQELTRSVGSWMAYRDGKINLSKTKISVEEILDHIHFSFEDKFNEKKISLKCQKPSENFYIIGDKTAVFYQIFSNVISNAIKYSFDNSEIEISFKDGGNFVIINVTDNGVGIKPELLERVFSPYAITSSRGTKDERGTGFGLPIVATVIEKMNGKISIANRSCLHPEQKGTVVTMILPKSLS